MNASGWFWIAWLAAFAIREGWALFNKTPGDTFSEFVWYWVEGYQWAHPAREIANRRTMVQLPSRHGKVNEYGTKNVKMAQTDNMRLAGIPAIPIERHSTWTWRTFMVGAFLLWLFFHLTFGMFAG